MGNVEVLAEATLTITAGIRVEFQDFYSLHIQGSIQALGTVENRIHFTSSNPELFLIDHFTDGAWNGIRFSNTSYLNEASLLQYCILEYSKNTEENGIGATVSCFDFSNLKIENCLFQNNAADYGGAIGLEFNSNPMIINNIFIDNYAFLGGSTIYCTYSYPKIVNNTIIENQVLNEAIFVSTGAIHSFQSKPQLYNNIIWDNEDFFFEESPLLFCKPFYVKFNDIEYGFEGEGNIDLDPFIFEEYPYQLQANSPCIDAGCQNLPYNIQLPQFDIGGNSRLYGEHIDMGALEWQNSTANHHLTLANNQLTNYPNPFNPNTEIRFQISDFSKIESVNIKIYNLKGQLIRQFSISNSQISIIWDGTDQNNQPVSSGIYFAKAKVGNQNIACKMLLMK